MRKLNPASHEMVPISLLLPRRRAHCERLALSLYFTDHSSNFTEAFPFTDQLSQYFDALMSLFNVLLILAGILEYVLLGIDFENNKANEYLGAILIFVAFLNAFIECKCFVSLLYSLP